MKQHIIMDKISRLKEISIRNIKAYIQGNLRYILYYSKFKFLIRKHIREQIEYRIKVMNPTCYDSGSCIVCGCATPHLQMADKVCDGLCYPFMIDRKAWNKKLDIHTNTMIVWRYDKQNKKYRVYDELTYKPLTVFANV